MILRNLSRTPQAFDLPALGTQTHAGGVSALDPQTGLRTLREHTRELPRSLDLAACHDPRAPIASAIADGSAVAGLPDDVADDPTVKRLVAARVLVTLKETVQ